MPRSRPLYRRGATHRPSAFVRGYALFILAFALATCAAPAKSDADAVQESPPTTPLATSLTSTIPPRPTASLFPAAKCLEAAPAVVVPPRRAPLEVQTLSEGDVWLWEEERGAPRQITSTGDARDFTVSDDSQVVALVRAVTLNESELWAVDSDGGNLRRLLSIAQLELLASNPQAVGFEIALLGWIDQSHSVRVQLSPHLEGIGHVEPYGEWAVDVDTGAFSRHIAPETLPGLVSPDGQHVAIVTETSLSLMGADGSGRRDDIVTYPFIGLGDYAFIPPTRWSSQSDFLRAIIPSADPFAPEASFTTWIIPLESPPTALATFNGFPLDVSLSPNQEYVAFWRITEPLSNFRELHLARFDTSRQVLYESGYVLEFLTWAPDSVHFVFWLPHSRPMLGHICGAPLPLLDRTISGWVTWIDSGRFLFATGEERSQELRLGSVDGSDIFVGPLVGDFATYRFNQDPGAIGLGGN